MEDKNYNLTKHRQGNALGMMLGFLIFMTNCIFIFCI